MNEEMEKKKSTPSFLTHCCCCYYVQRKHRTFLSLCTSSRKKYFLLQVVTRVRVNRKNASAVSFPKSAKCGLGVADVAYLASKGDKGNEMRGNVHGRIGHDLVRSICLSFATVLSNS